MNKYQARDNLIIAWIKTISVLSRYVAIPDELAAKTYGYYLGKIEELVRDLYRKDIDRGSFVGQMAELIQAQLTRAWNEGMRENGLDPAQDMETEWQDILDNMILDEYNYVDSFAADIVAASDQQLDWNPLLSRAQLWANRYPDVVTKATLITKEQKLIWIYGDTEHCNDCLHLNGIVAWASEWEEVGIRPQSSDLECGGWRCQCQLIPTSNRHTRNAVDAIRNALSR
jgi:hypothetical protein